MSEHTQIGWTSATWNCLVGCKRVSSGCAKCFAIRETNRMAHNPNEKIRAANEGLVMRHRNGQLDWTGMVRFIPERLELPLRWQEPRRIFVASLSDVWHPDVTLPWLAQMWAVMALSPWHTFQVLTKRPERIRPTLSHPDFYDLVRGAMDAIKGRRYRDKRIQHIAIPDPAKVPLPNVWLGTSVEDQDAAEGRIPHLLEAPAALRFLSCEPLLGFVDLGPWLTCSPDRAEWCLAHYGRTQPISWVIAGGESGPGYRPVHLDWLRLLRDQCDEAGVAFFLKQIGGITPKSGGKELDGVEHCEFPVVAA